MIVRRRQDDGTVVMLACRKLDTRNGEPPIGPTIVPEPEPPPTSWPTAGFREVFHTISTPLVVDISDLPRGVLLFEPRRFALTALQAMRNGLELVDLDAAGATMFGFHGVTELPE